jgi:hypothetical protein
VTVPPNSRPSTAPRERRQWAPGARGGAGTMWPMRTEGGALSRSVLRWFAAGGLIVAMALAGCSIGGDGSANPEPFPSPSPDDCPVVEPADQAPSGWPPVIEFPPFEPPEEPVPVSDAEALSRDVADTYSWSALEIGGGGYVTGIETHSAGLVVARTDVGGAFVHDQESARWKPLLGFDRIADPLPGDYQVESIALAPSDADRLYLAAGEGGPEGRVLASDDGGRTWTSGAQRFTIAGNAEWRAGGERLAVDPSDPDTVWLATRTEGLWRSTDAATTFERVEGIPSGAGWEGGRAGITFVLADSGSVYAGITCSGVWRADADGTNWALLWPSDALAYDAELDISGRLWTTEPRDGRVRRFDPATGGVATFQPAGEALDYSTIAIDPRDPDHVIVTGPDSLGAWFWQTEDGGRTWQEQNVDLECAVPGWLEDYSKIFLSVASLEFDQQRDGRVWFPEGFGVWRADDVRNGIRFVCETLGIEELVANDIAVPVGGPPIAASWDRPLFSLQPGGAETAILGPSGRFNSAWSLATTPALPSRVYGVVGDHRFCCEDDGQAFWAGYTDDGGRSWQALPSIADGSHPFDLRFGNLAVSSVDPDVMLWLPSFNRPLHRSIDGGATWEPVIMPGMENRRSSDGRLAGGAHFAFFLDRHVLVADPIEGDTFYLFHPDLGLLATTDAGATWEQRSGDGLALGSIGAFNARLEAVPGRSGHLLFTPGPSDEDVFPLYESVDGGRTWRVVPGTAEVVALGFGLALEPDGPPVVFAAGEIDGVRGLYRSSDELATWELVTEAPTASTRASPPLLAIRTPRAGSTSASMAAATSPARPFPEAHFGNRLAENWRSGSSGGTQISRFRRVAREIWQGGRCVLVELRACPNRSSPWPTSRPPSPAAIGSPRSTRSCGVAASTASAPPSTTASSSSRSTPPPTPRSWVRGPAPATLAGRVGRTDRPAGGTSARPMSSATTQRRTRPSTRRSCTT